MDDGQSPAKEHPPLLALLRDYTSFVLGTIGFGLQMLHWWQTGTLNTWYLSLCGLLMAGPDRLAGPFVSAILAKITGKK